MANTDDPGGGRHNSKMKKKNTEDKFISSYNAEHQGQSTPQKKPNSDSDKNNTKTPRFYTISDKGPFISFIESTEQSGNNIGKFNHLKIAKEIFNLNLKDVKKINKKGINRISVEFKNFQEANNFVNNVDLKSKGYNIFIPYNFVSSKGLIRGVHSSITTEEIQKNSNSKIKILDARRSNRKVINKTDNSIEYVPTNTILLTFQGTILPRNIEIYGLDMPVIPYVPPVTMCFNCLRYGHTKSNCKSKKKCYNCGDFTDHENPEEKNFSCNTKCVYCNQNHKSSSKECPEYDRQKSIRQLIAYENITFYDANILCKKTYNSNENRQFTYHPTEFPKLPKQPSSSGPVNSYTRDIDISQRRIVQFNENNKRSYQQTTTEPPRKKTMYTGFDRKAHEDALIFSNGRPHSENFHIYGTHINPNLSEPTPQLPSSAQQINKSTEYRNIPIYKHFVDWISTIPIEDRMKIVQNISTYNPQTEEYNEINNI